MNFKIIRYLLTGIFLVLLNASEAQNKEQVYFSEIGLNGGTSFYIGDANSTLFKNPQLSAGLIYRQKINSRLAAHLEWNYTNVKGSGIITDGSSVPFSNTLNVLDVCGEFNFFSYERKPYLPFSQIFSPFIFAGVGGMLYQYENTSLSFPKFSIPFGVGFKLMLGNRFNVNLMWSQRLLLTDQMEGVSEFNNSAGLNGTNVLNNDLLSTVSLGITYNFWKKKCNCSNERF